MFMSGAVGFMENCCHEWHKPCESHIAASPAVSSCWADVQGDGGSCTQLGVLGTAGSNEMQVGLLMHVLFFFNRKMTISRNALKLSSRILSSSTERSEYMGCFF